MGEAMIFVVDSDEAVGQCDDEDMRKLEALAANESDEQVSTCRQTDLDLELKKTEEKSDSNDEGFEGIAQIQSIRMMSLKSKTWANRRKTRIAVVNFRFIKISS